MTPRDEQVNNTPQEVSGAYKHTLQVVRGVLAPEQPMQLHSFSGGLHMVKGCSGVFSNTYFSYSGLEGHFTEHQRGELLAVPNRRLLLETDSPYSRFVLGN